MACTEANNGGGMFHQAFTKQNVYMETAIQSLDRLNDQLLQFIFAKKACDLDLDHDLTPKDQDTLKATIALMRGLLMDAQRRFRKMVDDNKELASHIDGSLQAANSEVNTLRNELRDTSRRLSLLSEGATAANKPDVTRQSETDNNNMPPSGADSNGALDAVTLREENACLHLQVAALQKELEQACATRKMVNSTDESKVNELKLDLIQTKQELNRAKEALQAMRADRKRLKAEKFELLSQMKQLYCTLEDKEAELRDFIRNYEHRMRDSDNSIKQLAADKEVSEREKWEILKRARAAAERAVALRSELDDKEMHTQRLETELAETQSQLKVVGYQYRSSSDRLSAAAGSLDGRVPSGDELPPYTETPPRVSPAKSDRPTGSQCLYTPQKQPNGSIDNIPPLGESSKSSDDVNEGVYVTIATTNDIKRKKKKVPTATLR